MQQIEASDITALVFDARSDGASYRVLAFAESLGPMPTPSSSPPGASWRRIVIPLGGIDGLDPTRAMGFLIVIPFGGIDELPNGATGFLIDGLIL